MNLNSQLNVAYWIIYINREPTVNIQFFFGDRFAYFSKAFDLFSAEILKKYGSSVLSWLNEWRLICSLSLYTEYYPN
jgi:hypothetical protein